MKTEQMEFVAVRDWTQPQIITPYGLEKLLAEARTAGFRAISLAPIRFPFGYRVVFARMTDREFVHPFSHENLDKSTTL